MIKLISLDLWDTLITDGGKMEQERDSKRADFIVKTLNLPETDKEKIMEFFGELVHSFKSPSKKNKWAILPETQLQYLFKKLNAEPSDEQFEEILKVYEEEALNNPPSLTEPDLRETLENLKKHYKLALISNTGRVPGKILQKILKEEGLLCLFDVLTFSDEVRMRKPDKDIFLLTCERACADPDETIHIGDSVNIDFIGAQNANVHPLLYVKYPKKPGREPYIRSIKEIEEAIRKFHDKN